MSATTDAVIDQMNNPLFRSTGATCNAGLAHSDGQPNEGVADMLEMIARGVCVGSVAPHVKVDTHADGETAVVLRWRDGCFTHDDLVDAWSPKEQP